MFTAHEIDWSTWIMLACGYATLPVVLLALLPGQKLEQVFGGWISPAARLLIRHWAISVAFLGIGLIWAAHNSTWREPVAIFALIQKTMAILFLFLSLDRLASPKLAGSVILLDTLMVIGLSFVVFG